MRKLLLFKNEVCIFCLCVNRCHRTAMYSKLQKYKMKRNPNEFIKQRKQNSDLNYNQHDNINARQRTEDLYIITWSNQRNREQV